MRLGPEKVPAGAPVVREVKIALLGVRPQLTRRLLERRLSRSYISTALRNLISYRSCRKQ